MSIADKLVVLGTKISNALTYANEALTAKGGNEANSLWEIGARIREIEVGGGDDNEFTSLVCKTISKVNNNDIEFVGDYAFINCSSLTSVDLPVCTNIGNQAFANCSSLTSVNLPACTNIGGSAFINCSSLTSVDLPVCTNIGSSAFQSCTSLTTIILRCPSVAALKNSRVFYFTPIQQSLYTGAFGSIYVPASLVTSYQTATNWTYFSSRITAIVE